MNIFSKLHQDILKTIFSIYGEDTSLTSEVRVEFSKDENSYDMATNAAMCLAKKLRLSPQQVAAKLSIILSELDYVDNVEIAGPGFLNFTIVKLWWQHYLNTLLTDDYKSDYCSIGKGKRVNIEYVSANPTGPMHIGHARGAVYGDALANILQATGYEVDREYYINDAGSQIDTLSRSLYLRYKQALSKASIDIPQGLYPGEYLIPVGEALVKKYSDSLLHMNEEESELIIKDFAIKAMMSLVKEDLALIGVKHDVFFSERILHEENKIGSAINALKEKKLVYLGSLPCPKGKKDESWKEKTQLLFKSTLYGDDQDRPLQKEDGSWSYFAADIAYAKDKIDRNYDSLLLVLGADHCGYTKRIKAVVQALSKEKNSIFFEVKICQLVNFIEDGLPIKMSKRAGKFTTVRDVYEAVGKDVIRFIMLTRRNDAIIDFDLAKVQEHSQENPIFYVKYAFARTCSLLKNAEQNAPIAYQLFSNFNIKYELLNEIIEINLIKKLSMFPRIIENSSKYFEPHRVAFYLQNLASVFHSMWTFKVTEYKFIVKGDDELTAARLALVASVNKILQEGCRVIGVDCSTEM